MALLKAKTLEGYIQVKLISLCLFILVLFALFAWQVELDWQWIVTFELAICLLCFWFIVSFKKTILSAFCRASLHVDAIIQEDYNQFAKSPFASGKVNDFHLHLKQLSEQLQSQKSHYDQHAFLVYQLISQLDTPVLVFSEKQQLTFGNDAFIHLFKQPWQMLRHASADLLGLHYIQHQWCFSDEIQQKQWQIKHSEFIDNGAMHQLLVFINIEPVLRASQLKAWQQIIRVLGHEIRNSLTPVSSMAETLAEATSNTRDKMVLDVIAERCLHLQSFVDRYSSISQQLQVNCQWSAVNSLITSVSSLHSGLNVESSSIFENVWADKALLEQVLINLLKNAKEAKATKVALNFSTQDNFYLIEVIDNGHGFANLDNLFVPLYSTKPQGQGVGLSLCRNIIEQHHGVVQLYNNKKGLGVTVTILLPIPTDEA
ncbi:MAG: ATP-binding protein [Litorilituus sp.]|jgi:nitrogen fixation/metabolism regulation signal transduction histidine kinase|nr:ATP-binding protein [Litorilituus sp.]